MTFFYQGHFDDTYLKEILRFVEQTREVLDNRFSIGKVAFLIAESFQNIIRHGITDYDDHGVASDVFCVRNISPFIHIFSSNLVETEEAKKLEEKLARLHSMDKATLREDYLNILATGEVSDKGGAGLGLVAMARKSYKAMQYKFVNDGHEKEMLYDLQIDLLLNKKGPDNLKYLSIDENTRLIDGLKKEKVIFFYAGEINSETTLPLLYLIRKNAEFTFIQNDRVNKLYHIGVEMLENIILNGKKEEDRINGTFNVAVKDNSFILTAESYFSHEKCLYLSNLIDELNAKSKEELDEDFQNTLINCAKNDADSRHVGIIDIARLSSKPLTHRHVTTENGDHFSLTAYFK